ncbi:hypothetical protein MSAN_00269500 [Mycena sanguinolenta]|uniref:Uncharacterized protein n=1 Tax=Mycena sanguinolenta TaxID=230812 RepID=A0A8H6ZJB8_9AGAR|nr:hypothetical protein MSAN_00269500 [Mycena sanguinolenta]
MAVVTGSPYLILLPTVIFAAWSNAAYGASIVLNNIPALNAHVFFRTELPVLLLPVLELFSTLFYYWSFVLQFVVVILLLRNREAALRATPTGRDAIHVALALLAFTFGTAAAGLEMATTVKYNNPHTYAAAFGGHGKGAADYLHRRHVQSQLYSTHQSFVVLTGVDVVATAVVLWRRWRKAGLTDTITSRLVTVLAPLYSLFCLLVMVFAIILSPSGISSFDTNLIESANLAGNILVTGFSIAILFFILALSVRRAWWNPDAYGGSLMAVSAKQQEYWTQQPVYMYATAPPSQPGYYNPQQLGTPYTQPGTPYAQSAQMSTSELTVQQGSYTPQRESAAAPQAERAG